MPLDAGAAGERVEDDERVAEGELDRRVVELHAVAGTLGALVVLNFIASGGRGQAVRSVRELRRARARTVALPVAIPAAARGRACVSVVAGADSARPASARVCAPVRAAAPLFTG